MQSKLEQQQKEIKKKYKEYRDGQEVNAQVANAIKVSADLEYKNSYTFGWGGVYMVDRFQSMLTGHAITTNTQKLLDAEVLKQKDTAPAPKS